MTKHDMPEFTERLYALATCFDVVLTEARVEMYGRALADIPLADLRGGLEEALDTCKFFPKVSEIRELACGTTGERADDAWLHFRALARNSGAGFDPATDEALQATVVALFGGWRGAGQAELTDYTHRQFLDTYARADVRAQRRGLEGGDGQGQLE